MAAGNRLTPGSKTPWLDFANDLHNMGGRQVTRVWRNATFHRNSFTGRTGERALRGLASTWGGKIPKRKKR